MKLERSLGIVTLLLQRGKMTAPELAKRFEVSRRTINRDIETLCQAGIPIVTTQGRGGGIMLAEGYTWDRSLLTEAETALLQAGLGGIESVLQSQALRMLQEKLAHSVRDVVMIDLASHYQDQLTSKLQLIKQAIETQHEIRFTYHTASGESVRQVEPYHLIFHWSDWYVLGYCAMRQDFRLFKLNRLWDVQMMPDVFVPKVVPAEVLDLDAVFAQGKIIFRGLFEPSARHRLVEEYGPHSFMVRDDGKLFFEWRFLRKDHLLQWVLSFGAQVMVLEPLTLREQVAAIAQEMIRQMR